jgi:TRAP-type C4-dicarboxylate transport system permease small subunit
MPLRGGFELTEIMLAAIIFAALPLTTARREHVAFDSFNPVAAAAMPLVIRGAALISAAALAFLGWRLWIYADSLHTGKIASATLSLPMYPLAYLMSACVLVSAGVFAWLSILGHDEGPTGIPNA